MSQPVLIPEHLLPWVALCYWSDRPPYICLDELDVQLAIIVMTSI